MELLPGIPTDTWTHAGTLGKGLRRDHSSVRCNLVMANKHYVLVQIALVIS